MCSYMYRRGAVYCTRMIVPLRLRPIIGKSDLGRSLTAALLRSNRLDAAAFMMRKTLEADRKEFGRFLKHVGH